MTSRKIKLCFEVFKQLKNYELSYLPGATKHKDTGIYWN